MAPRKVNPNFSRRRLARKIRQARIDRGWTLEQAAPLLEKTRSALGRIERGETRVDTHLLRSIMDVYDFRDESLFELARQAAKPGWWRAYGVDDLGYVPLETEARTVYEYCVNIPGLLQTEDYIRAQLGVGPKRSKREFENQARLRFIRRERLSDAEHPLDLVAIVDEAALTREVGGPKVMAAQLRHLLKASELPRVTLQVLPFHVGAHVAMAGPFILLDFPDPEDPDLLYVEYPTGAQHIEKPEEVRAAKLVVERLRSCALSPDDSRTLLQERLTASKRGR